MERLRSTRRLVSSCDPPASWGRESWQDQGLERGGRPAACVLRLRSDDLERLRKAGAAWADESIDALLNRAREVTDHNQRAALYRDAIEKFAFGRRNIIYLYHQNYIVAYPKNLKGYKAVPDGLIRLKGTSWQ